VDRSADGEWADLLGNLPNAQVSGGTLKVTLPPLSAGWFQQS